VAKDIDDISGDVVDVAIRIHRVVNDYIPSASPRLRVNKK
jgi:hypothetical protein